MKPIHLNRKKGNEVLGNFPVLDVQHFIEKLPELVSLRSQDQDNIKHGNSLSGGSHEICAVLVTAS